MANWNRVTTGPRTTRLHFETLEPRLTPSAQGMGMINPHVFVLAGANPSATAFVQSAAQVGAAHHFAQVSFTQTNLVSDQANTARFTDSNLVNAWGIARTESGNFWVADNGSGEITEYSASGRALSPVITVPQPDGITPGGTPTGIVLNQLGNAFRLKNGQRSEVIAATEDGTIVAWGRSLGSKAEVEFDNSASGAVYKGLAEGRVGNQTYLYATNFNAGTIDVFDTHFHLVTTLPGNFTDPGTLPPLPAGATGYAPFGIRNIDGLLYVTYAAQDSTKHDDVAGAGAGFVDVFRTNGTFVRRLTTGGTLNSPWGLAEAPTQFGQFSNALLVGNFGDGTISAYNRTTGAFLGQLSDSTGATIHIPGLWGLDFGGNGNEGHSRDLFFASGPGGEDHGLFGTLRASSK